MSKGRNSATPMAGQLSPIGQSELQYDTVEHECKMKDYINKLIVAEKRYASKTNRIACE